VTPPADPPGAPPIELTLSPEGRLCVHPLTPEVLRLLLELFPHDPELLERAQRLPGAPEPTGAGAPPAAREGPPGARSVAGPELAAPSAVSLRTTEES